MGKEKGVDSFAVKKLAKILTRIGYRRDVIQSDQEPAIIALKEAGKREVDFEVELAFEESPVGEHQSNGEIENAINRISGQLRVSKDALESRSRCKCKIERDNPILAWLICHTVASIISFQVGTGGKTAHERLIGRKFRRDVAEYGDKSVIP